MSVVSTPSSPVPMTGLSSPEPEEELEYNLVKVIVYDRGSQGVNLRICRKNIVKEMTRNICSKFSISREEGKLHSLVLVITTSDLKHCVRTLKPEESALDVLEELIKKLCEKYSIGDPSKLRSSVRWFYKDTRTPPLDLGDSGVTVGEYDSDDEEVLTESDCFYFSKVEKKGYMLKRSSKDINLWKRWYCVLADHLWCIDFNRDPYKVICIRLHSLVRSRNGHSFSDQIQNIIVNSLKGSHYFRAFNILDQKTWIDHLVAWTSYAMDNDSITMAEVIINDEEDSKARRYRKHLQRILDSDVVFEAVRADHRKPPFMSRENSLAQDLDSLSKPVVTDVAQQLEDAATGSNDDLGDAVERVSLEDENISESNSRDGQEEVEGDDKEGLNRQISAEYSTRGHASVWIEAVPLNPLDRTLKTFTQHRLHQYEFLLSYFLQFLLDVQHYKDLFRHDLFCSLQSQRQAALTIFTQYLYRQGKTQGAWTFSEHEKLREMCEEAAEQSSAKLKLAMSVSHGQRPMDMYIASPSSLSSLSLQQPPGDGSSGAAGAGWSQSYNSAALRSPAAAHRMRPVSIIMRRFRKTQSMQTMAVNSNSSNSNIKSSAGNRHSMPTTSTSRSTSPLPSALIQQRSNNNPGYHHHHHHGHSLDEDITEENWKVPSDVLQHVANALFGVLLTPEEDVEQEGVDGENGETGEVMSFSNSRISTVLPSTGTNTGKMTLANSRKSPFNSPTPTHSTVSMTGGGSQKRSSPTNPATPAASGSGFSSFFGLFGGSAATTGAGASTTSSDSTAGRGQTNSTSGFGGGLFSRRKGAGDTPNGKKGGSGSGGASASVARALEEQERAEVLSQVQATAEVFDGVVEEVVRLLER